MKIQNVGETEELHTSPIVYAQEAANEALWQKIQIKQNVGDACLTREFKNCVEEKVVPCYKGLIAWDR